MAHLIRSSNLLVRRAQSVPTALYHKNVSKHGITSSDEIKSKEKPIKLNCMNMKIVC